MPRWQFLYSFHPFSLQNYLCTDQPSLYTVYNKLMTEPQTDYSPHIFASLWFLVIEPLVTSARWNTHSLLPFAICSIWGEGEGLSNWSNAGQELILGRITRQQGLSSQRWERNQAFLESPSIFSEDITKALSFLSGKMSSSLLMRDSPEL